MKIASKKRKAGKSLGPKRRKVGFINSPFKSPAMQRGNKNEKKWVDLGITGSHFDNVSTEIYLLNGLQRGTDAFNRIGRRVQMKSIHIRGYVVNNGTTASPQPDYLRCAIVYDREANGATPAWSDIFQDTTLTGATTSTALASLNLNNADRFAVLKEWRWSTVGGTPNTATADPAQSFPTATEMQIRWNKKVNLDVRFNSGSAGTASDITTGALYLCTQGVNTSANHQWDLNWDSRVRFLDA